MSVYPKAQPVYRTRPPVLGWSDLDALASFVDRNRDAFEDHLAGRGQRLPRGRARQIRRRLEAVLDREL